MKLVGLMLAKNEDWILGLSARVALKWCDELVIVDHSSTDRTMEIINQIQGENPRRVKYSRWDDAEKWDEMEMRQHSLDVGRKYRGTHFAMIDADEILTANLLPEIRDWVFQLQPGQVLDVPMIPVWKDLQHYRHDDSVWSRAKLSIAFADAAGVTWKPDRVGYQHHHRVPYGCLDSVAHDCRGGAMHLQFVNKHRLLAKHILYRMVDYLRWPGRETPQQLNRKYDQALDEAGMRLQPMPSDWLSGYDLSKVSLDGMPWQEFEVRRLLREHGAEKFAGLDLKGFTV